MATPSDLAGTIIVAVRCDDYVILAADSQCHHADDTKDFSAWQYRKITLHESLPLAIAHGGYAFLETTEFSVADRIAEIFRHFKDAVSPLEIFHAIVGELAPIVQMKRNSARRSGTDPMNVILYAGMVEGGQTLLCRALIEDAEPRVEDRSESLNVPPHLRQAFREMVNDHFFGRDCATPFDHAEHLRGIIRHAYELDAIARPGLAPTVGGEIVVAVADSTGSRFS